VTYLNLVIFFLAVSFGSITLLVFSDASLSYVLKTINIPDDSSNDPTGSLAGRIVLYSEVLICVAIWGWGMISDRIGRRWVFGVGTLLIATSFVAMPFASTYADVLGIRLVFAAGAAAVSAMLMALVCDYPRDDTHNKSRGKASAIMGCLAGLGAIFALFGLLAIPSLFPSNTPAGVYTGKLYMFLAAAGVAILCGVVSFFGLAKVLFFLFLFLVVSKKKKKQIAICETVRTCEYEGNGFFRDCCNARSLRRVGLFGQLCCSW
jgi:MFS family permease